MQAPLFGDPTKPGSYGVLIKWLPGHMSRPHHHSTDLANKVRWDGAKDETVIPEVVGMGPASSVPVPDRK